MIVLDKIESVVLSRFACRAWPALRRSLACITATAGKTPTISDPAIPPGSRGFIITLSITTPHSLGFQYVLEFADSESTED